MKFLCLTKDNYVEGNYVITGYREQDIFNILDWRNHQLEILRQKKPITTSEQQQYFKTKILPAFSQTQPAQILFSYLHNNILIGYGGLTNIDWDCRRAELSFLLNPERVKNKKVYSEDFTTFIQLSKQITFDELDFNRFFTETYSFRKFHISILEKNGFKNEGTMRKHVFINNKFVDSIIHGILKSDYYESER